MQPTGKVMLGKSGVAVTRICFGLAPLGSMPDTYGHSVEAETARQTVRAIFAGPVNFLDTSRNYGFGRSEERVGEVIREHGGLPQGFVISTKLDRDMRSGRFDAARARRSLEESLEALNVSRVQILHLHDPEYAASLAEVSGPRGALAELFRMKDEGLAEAVGLAAGQIDTMMPLLRDWDFDLLITHNRFTLANRNAEEMIDFARHRGIAVVNAAPYAGGVLAKGTSSYARYVYQEASPEMLAPIRRIEQLCARHAVAPGAAALQFSLRDERVASTICGISRPERVAQTLDWAQRPIPAAFWEELAALAVDRSDPEATRIYRPG